MLWTIIKRLVVQVGDTNMFLTAAGVAFYGMFALFPGMAALISMFALISDPAVLMDQLELMRAILPEQIYKLVSAQIGSLMTARSDKLGWAGFVSLIIAIWLARAGVGGLILGLNTILGRRNRSNVRHYMTALLLTVVLLGVAIVSLASVVVAPVVLAFIPLGPSTALLVDVIRWAAAIAVLIFGLALIYRYGPNRRSDAEAPDARMRWITPGAALAVVLWAAASYGFSLYLGNFGRYNEVYGSIGAAVAMLMWLYISAFLILLGAALNVQLMQRRSLDKASKQMGA